MIITDPRRLLESREAKSFDEYLNIFLYEIAVILQIPFDLLIKPYGKT